MKNFFGSLILVMLAVAPMPQFAMKVSLIHVTVQIFEIVDCKTDQDPGMTLRGTQKRYCFAGKAIVDETQIASVSVWISEYEEKPGLRLKFKAEGAARLLALSSALSLVPNRRDS